MIQVIDIWEETQKIVGNHDDKFLFRRITDAVELLANKGDFDPLLVTLDLVSRGRVVTLPPEVETILGLNICGHPAVARDEFFQFHLNGPGSHGWGNWGGGPFGPEIRYEWMDLNDSPIYRDVECPDSLIAYCVSPSDVNSELWIHGFDINGNVIRTQLPNGEWRDGWKVPVFQFTTALPPNPPVFSRITGVSKAVTAGPIRLSTVGGILLGVYQSNETLPKYRRIKLSRDVPFITIRFRQRTWSVRSKYDLLPLASRQAVLMMLRALVAYDAKDIGTAEGFEATAVRWMTEEQFTSNPPVAAPIQVLQSAPLMDGWDFME